MRSDCMLKTPTKMAEILPPPRDVAEAEVQITARVHCPVYRTLMPDGPFAPEKALWNVQGCKDCCTNPAFDEPIARIAAALEDLPCSFKVGWTGYIELDPALTPETYGKGWVSDGRNVFVLGPKILFQRFVEGNVYVGKTWWENGVIQGNYSEVTPKMWQEFVAAAEAHRAGK